MNYYNVDMKEKRKQTRGEEIANSVTHGVAALLILIFSPLMVLNIDQRHHELGVVVTTIFTISIFAMFFSSCLYHCLSDKNKKIFHLLDHIFIFLAIAGTYTPIAIIIIGGWQGIVLISLQYFIVIIGTLYKILLGKVKSKSNVIFYLAMGWLVIIFFYSFITKADPWLVFFISLGGICYTIGAIFYKRKYRYAHMIWHMFVIFGALAHFIGILLFL